MGRLIAFFLVLLFASPAFAACPSTIADCASPTYNALTAHTVTVQQQTALGTWATGSEPSSPSAGWFGYNTTDHIPEYYNGTAWVEVGSGGGGGTSCWTGSPGTNCFYTTNTGSPWRGAFEASESAWTPPTIANGQWSFYHSIILQSVGLTNRTTNVADQWNASLFGSYIEGFGSAALYNSHFVGQGIYTYIPAGLTDGQNGGTFSGGLPGNPNYEEIGGLTAVGEMGSPGDYTENVASYVCDNLGCTPGATGNKSRMTGFLAAVYKNYAGTDYGTSGFIADSLGTQQTTNAPSSILRGLGGWLVGLDFTGVTNIPGFVAIALPDQTSIISDATDLEFWVNDTQIQTLNTSAVTLSVPLVFTAVPSGTSVSGACFTSANELIGCAGGGGSGVASFNTRTGAVTLQASDVSGVGGFLTTGGTVTGATTFSASGAGSPAISVTTGSGGGYGAYLYADTLTLHNALAPDYGGLGFNAASAANGAIPIGDGTGFVLSTITAGTGISITNGAGTITITNTGGGSGGVSSFNSRTGAVTLTSTDVSNATGMLTSGGTFTGAVGISVGASGTGLTVSNAASISGFLTGGGGASFAGDVAMTGPSTGLNVTNAVYVGGLLHGAAHAQFDQSVWLSSSGITGAAIAGTGTDFQVYIGGTQLADMNTSSATFSVSPNTASGIIYYSQGSPGITGTCTFTAGASVTFIGGIATAKSGC